MCSLVASPNHGDMANQRPPPQQADTVLPAGSETQRDPPFAPGAWPRLLIDLDHTPGRLQDVLDHLPAMISYWDRDQRNVLANRAYLDWFGLTPEQMRGRHLRDVLGEHLYTLSTDHIDRALAGVRQVFERSVRDVRGIARYTQASYIPDFVDGEVHGFFALVTDITRLKQTERSLADEAARMRTILDAVSDAVLCVDLGWVVTEMNAATAPMLGVPASEVLGRPLTDVVRLYEGRRELPLAALCEQCLIDHAPMTGGQLSELSTLRQPRLSVEWRLTPLQTATGASTGVVLTLRDVAENRARLDESQRQALHDPLTGMKNRRYLSQFSHQRATDSAPACVLFMDLDGFKRVNDTCGHVAGDAVLREVSKVIRSAVRISDELIRLGGDEFIVLLHDCPLDTATKLAQKIVDAVDAHHFHWLDNRVHLGVSVGMAQDEQGSDATLESVIVRADAACYEAKRAGGNRVVVDLTT